MYLKYVSKIRNIPSPDLTFLIGTQLEPKKTAEMVIAIYPIDAGIVELESFTKFVATVEYAVVLFAMI